MKHLCLISIIVAIIFLFMQPPQKENHEQPQGWKELELHYNPMYIYEDKNGLRYRFDSSDIRKGENFEFINFMISRDPEVYYAFSYSLDYSDSTAKEIFHPVITNFKVQLLNFQQ